MLRISIVALVFGALAPPAAHGAPEPKPISIASANLKAGLTQSDIKQVRTHAEYWVAELAAAERAEGVYNAREGILADYNKYGDSLRYKVEFARSTAAVVPTTLAALSQNDRLKAQKEINFAIVISKMPQLTAISAMDVLVKHANPGVRFLGWQGYKGVRDDAIRGGGAGVKTLQAALQRHAGTEPSPLVAAVIVDVMRLDTRDLKSKTFQKAFDLNFNTLIVMQKTTCSRLAAGDADWARPCIAALPILRDANEFYKPDNKKTAAILQQLINVAQAGAKAYAAAGGTGPKAFQCVPLLLQVEPIIGSISNDSGRDIRDPLLDKKKGDVEKATAIRRGVLEWIDRLEELGVKTPVFAPIKKPSPTTQPAKTTA
jgi:hypothetical protein